MEQLIRENPSRALDRSLALHEWVALPADIRAQVEEPFSTIGDYEVRSDCRPEGQAGKPDLHTKFITVDGQTLAAFVYGRRARLLSKYAVPLQGIRLSGMAALWETTMLRLDAADLAAALTLFQQGNPDRSLLTGQVLAPDGKVPGLQGGVVQYFAASEELSTYDHAVSALEEERGPYTVRDAMQAAAAGGPAPSALPGGPPPQGKAGWATTPKTQLVLRVVFSGEAPSSHPYTQAALTTAYNGASGVFNTHSYGKTNLVVTVPSQVFVLPQTKAYYQAPPGAAYAPNLMRDHARALALAAGINPSSYDLVSYWHPNLTGTDWTAPAFANFEAPDSWFKGDQGSRIQSIILHEVGHNYPKNVNGKLVR